MCVCVMRDERWVKGDTLIEKFAQNEKKIDEWLQSNGLSVSFG